MPTRLILTITGGLMKGKNFTFDGHDTFLLGRMSDCHLHLPDDPCVSRHHFLLEVNPPDARLRDLGSLNGTYVNGKKYGGRDKQETPEEATRRQYPEVDLRDGDEIKVGDTLMLLKVKAPAVCIECGAAIPSDKHEQCAWPGGTYMCAKCRKKVIDAGKPKAPKPIRCQKCGREVTGEAGLGRQGDYICQACRQQAIDDPMELIKQLLQGVQKPEMKKLKIPDYEVIKELGAGGFGAVYLVRHKEKKTLAALKIMLSRVAVDKQVQKGFLREIENMHTLQHEHIVQFLDSGSAGGIFFIVLEYCQGGNVYDLMTRHGGQLSLKEAGPIMRQALQGLAFAHQQGFVHRDLKPQNILLAGQAEPWTVKIADMGLAKNFVQAGLSGMTATGSYAGSFPFMPREQVTNFKFVKPVSDIWSMGATFYNMLTGQYPRDYKLGQDPMEVILHDKIVPINKRDPRIPKQVSAVIERALASKVEDRYQDGDEMIQALEKVL